jgi:hypothetical protein
MSRKSAADHPLNIPTSLLAIRPSDASHKAFLASKWADNNFGTGWGLGMKPFVGFARPRIESFVIDAIASNGSTVLVHRTTDSEKPISIAVFETFDTISGEGQWKHTKLLEIKVGSQVPTPFHLPLPADVTCVAELHAACGGAFMDARAASRIGVGGARTCCLCRIRVRTRAQRPAPSSLTRLHTTNCRRSRSFQQNDVKSVAVTGGMLCRTDSGGAGSEPAAGAGDARTGFGGTPRGPGSPEPALPRPATPSAQDATSTSHPPSTSSPPTLGHFGRAWQILLDTSWDAIHDTRVQHACR